MASRPNLSVCSTLLLLVSLGASPLRAQSEVHDFLKGHVGFKDKDMEALESGKVVVRVPKSQDNREIVAVAVVRVGVPSDFILALVQDVDWLFGGSESVTQIGKFGETPSATDLADLALPKDDIEALRKCKVASCDVKLPAGAIERLHQKVDWSAPDYSDQANEFIAQTAATYLQSYKSRGNAALATYDDKKEPLSVAEGFAILLKESPYLLEFDAAFHRYLANYPDAGLSDVEDVFYWSLEDFGLKPTLALKHVAVHPGVPGELAAAIIGVKQIYASHYYQAAVELMTVSAVSPEDPAQGSYLIQVARQRFDGKVGGIKRSMLESRVRDGSKKDVEGLKARLEERYQSGR